MKLQKFDPHDPANRGRPVLFNVDKYLSCVEEMIAADEVERALWMLDNLPGWYRDNVPIEVTQLRDQLHRRFWTPVDYSKLRCGANFKECTPEAIAEAILAMPRARLIAELIQKLDNPHIVEYGPGSYFVPHSLRALGKEFTYDGCGLGHLDNIEAREDLAQIWSTEPGKINVFVCFEVIEHLHNPVEIYQYSLKHNCQFDYIVLSTPLYTFGGGNPSWHTTDLGHLRTYTPREFAQFATKYWPGFSWRMELNDEMYLEGARTLG